MGAAAIFLGITSEVLALGNEAHTQTLPLGYRSTVVVTMPMALLLQQGSLLAAYYVQISMADKAAALKVKD